MTIELKAIFLYNPCGDKKAKITDSKNNKDVINIIWFPITLTSGATIKKLISKRIKSKTEPKPAYFRNSLTPQLIYHPFLTTFPQ